MGSSDLHTHEAHQMISDRLDKAKLCKIDVKRGNIHDGLKEVLRVPLPGFFVSYPILHKKTGEHLGYIMRLWAKNVPTPTIAVTSENNKESVYFFSENNVESTHLDENRNLLNDEGEIIRKNFNEDSLRYEVRGHDRSKRFFHSGACAIIAPQ